jgi:hypothetical protein
LCPSKETKWARVSEGGFSTIRAKIDCTTATARVVERENFALTALARLLFYRHYQGFS